MISDIFKKTEKRSGVTNPHQWLIDWAGGSASSSGIAITESKALGFPPIWAAVNVISGAVGALPLKVYTREEDGKAETPKHPVYKLLHDRPNIYMDALTFREVIQGHALVYGNGFAEIERDIIGRPTALWPLPPDKTFPFFTPAGDLMYKVRHADGSATDLLPQNVLHIKGFGPDGYVGYGAIRKLAEAIGVGMAAEKFGASFFGNGTTVSGVLQHPNVLSPEAQKMIRKGWDAVHTGLDSAHRLAILDRGLTYEQIGIPPEQAQFLETRKFSVTDVARIFQIPPHMIGDLERATFSNIEQQGISFVVHTLMRWLKKWEHECNYKLLSLDTPLFCEFLVEGLMRGDSAQRSNYYRQLSDMGILSVNEIRAKENLNTLDDENADKHFIQLNRAPLEDWTPAEPAPPAEPIDPPDVTDDERSIFARQLIAREVDSLRKLVSRGCSLADIASFYGRHTNTVKEAVAAVFGENGADMVARQYTEYQSHRIRVAFDSGDTEQVISDIQANGEQELCRLLVGAK